MNLSAVIAEPSRQLSPTATEYVRLVISPAGRDPLPDLSRAPVAVAFRPVERAQDLASPQHGDWVAVSFEDTGPDHATIAVLTGPNGGGTATAYAAPAVITLAYGTTVSVNASLGNDFRLTLTGSAATIANPTSPADGQVIKFQITQGTGGGFSLAGWGTAYDFGATGQPVLSTTAGKVDILGFCYNAALSSWCYLGSALGN